MTKQQIGTILHKLKPIDPDVNKMIGLIKELPHFILNEELHSLFNDDKAQASVKAMVDAGVARLPYPNMAIELWGGWDDRIIAIVSEKKGGGLKAVAFTCMASSGWTSSIIACKDISLPFPEWHVEYVSEMKDVEKAIHHVIAGINLAMLMVHMSEIEREVIEVAPALNKSRVASGKPKINNHVVVRIGHVYDRSGNKVRVTDGNRRSMPIHMRVAHTRRQHHGPDWMKEHPGEANPDYHIVFVPAVLVNYKDGSELPPPKPRVVRL